MPRDDRPGCCTVKGLTFHSMYVQINMQEPLWNETMLLSQKWTEICLLAMSAVDNHATTRT